MNHTEYHPAVWELDLLRDEGPHLLCIWGHIQDDVKARWIIQDLMKSNKRKSAGSARKGKKT